MLARALGVIVVKSDDSSDTVPEALRRGKNLATTRAALKRNTAAFHGGDDEGINVVVTIMAVNDLLQGMIETYSKSHDLSVGRSNFLLALFGAEGQTLPAYQLADALFVTRGNITFHLRTLLDAGLVSSRPDPDDRRYSQVSLTARGEAALRRYAPLHYRAVDAATAGLSSDEKRLLCGLLDKLQRHAEAAERAVLALGSKRRPRAASVKLHRS
jgi:DNA-binding MarR family transcriptional regulator